MYKIILESFGDLHPLAVHFPVGLMGFIAISLVLSKIGNLELPLPFFKWMNYFTLISLILAIALGLISENTRSFSGKDGALLEWHEKLGFATAILFGIACALLFFSDKIKNYFKWYSIFFLLSFIFLTIGGHLGSRIVHGENTLIDYFINGPTKEPTPKLNSQIGTVEEKSTQKLISKVDFNSQIKPIFEEHCFKCHGEKKQKGKLRLDTNDFHKVIEKLEPEKSKLYELITLPIDDEDIMPPKDGPLPKESMMWRNFNP